MRSLKETTDIDSMWTNESENFKMRDPNEEEDSSGDMSEEQFNSVLQESWIVGLATDLNDACQSNLLKEMLEYVDDDTKQELKQLLSRN